MNKVFLCPSTKVALIFYIYCCKNIYIRIFLYIRIFSIVPNLYLLFKIRNTAKGKHGLSYCFFPTCKPFPSLWKKPLYILKEKHPFPGRAQNMYQAGGKKKELKKHFLFSWGEKPVWEWALHSKLETHLQKQHMRGRRQCYTVPGITWPKAASIQTWFPQVITPFQWTSLAYNF